MSNLVAISLFVLPCDERAGEFGTFSLRNLGANNGKKGALLYQNLEIRAGRKQELFPVRQAR
jgi:hypothetical protein